MTDRIGHDACDNYIDELIQYIHDLQFEIDNLRRENNSYKLWMDRSIVRIKQMQES